MIRNFITRLTLDLYLEHLGLSLRQLRSENNALGKIE